VGGIAMSIWISLVGYGEYSDYINKNDYHQIETDRKKSPGCMVALIIFALIWFLFLKVFYAAMDNL
jgi:hypothetical protein